jgi:hypothetical protein
MYLPDETKALQHNGIRTGSACDTDDGSGAACFVANDPLFEVDYEFVPDVLVSQSYCDELRHG